MGGIDALLGTDTPTPMSGRPASRFGQADAQARRGGAFRPGLARFFLALVAALLAFQPMTAMAVDPAGRYTKDKTKSESHQAAPVEKSAPADTAPKTNVTEAATPLRSPANFDECVRVALAQSPLLVKSSIDIETKRLDLGDAYSSYIPTLSINTTYYFNRPSSSARKEPYTLSFSTGLWNPVMTIFEVQARKDMINIAVLSHLQIISEGIKRVGYNFLQLGMMEDQASIVKEKSDMADQLLEYAQTRSSLGQGTDLDVRIAESKITLVKAETDKLRNTKLMLMDDLKFILGVPFIQKVDLDLDAARSQVVAGFDPYAVTGEVLRENSYELKIQEYNKALQRKNITVSYIKFIPTFNFGFQSVDALSDTASQSGLPLYPYVTASLPLDWWTKSRDVNRQYKKLGQIESEARAKEFKLVSEFQRTMASLATADADVRYAVARRDLAQLKLQQTQFRFETGQTEFDSIVAAMDEYLGAKQEVLFKELSKSQALLDLRFLSGNLQRAYINVAVQENM
jgi:outer membrane protein TolC